jgi:hypothetical protein
MNDRTDSAGDATNEGTEWWQTTAMVLVVVAAIAGLVVIAMAVFAVLAMGSFGSNK